MNYYLQNTKSPNTFIVAKYSFKHVVRDNAQGQLI